jgi:hypothetical protein
MYQRTTGSYDEIPEGMKRYINNYGCHFNAKLCKEASERMYKKNNGKREYITPYSKDDVEELLANYNIKLQRGRLYDAVYVANMCKADFLGKSVPTEEHLAKYVKDVIDDADAEDGYVFNRFYADCMFMDNPIDWDEMV